MRRLDGDEDVGFCGLYGIDRRVGLGWVREREEERGVLAGVCCSPVG